MTYSKLLVGLSFLGGAFLASLDSATINWTYFIPVILAGALGVYLTRRAQAHAAQSSHVLAADRKTLEQSLNNILANLVELDGRKDKVPTYEMRFEIDRIFREDLMAFAEARNSLKHVFSLQDFADIVSSFAAGERYINRVWSASTDGYIDEVMTYIAKAKEQFEHAKEEFESAVQKHELEKGSTTST